MTNKGLLDSIVLSFKTLDLNVPLLFTLLSSIWCHNIHLHTKKYTFNHLHTHTHTHTHTKYLNIIYFLSKIVGIISENQYVTLTFQ